MTISYQILTGLVIQDDRDILNGIFRDKINNVVKVNEFASLLGLEILFKYLSNDFE